MSEEQKPKRWRTYHIHGKGYAEVFGPCAPGSDRIAVTSQEDADLIAAAPELVEACQLLLALIYDLELLSPNANSVRHTAVKRQASVAIQRAKGVA